MSREFLSPDPFLAGILGKPAFRLNHPDEVVKASFRTGQDSFAYAKIETTEPTQAYAIQDAGFRLVDTNVQLDRPLLGDDARSGVGKARMRFAEPADREAVEKIAASSFVFSRFHLDPAVPNEVANEIKRRWAGNYFSGDRGSQMVVAIVESRPAGFLQLLTDQDTLIIDLIAVAKEHRGSGIATDMIQFAASSYGRFRRLLVGTQIVNSPSIRVYEKLGFRVCASSYIFHYHGPISLTAAA